MHKKFIIGDTVKVDLDEAFKHYAAVKPPYTNIGEVVGYNAGDALVRFDDWEDGHGGHRLVTGVSRNGRDCWFITEANLTLVQKAPEMKLTPTVAPKPKFRRGTQLYMLLQHLSSGRTLTRITADHLYRVASLTKRIAELRAAGYDIVSIRKLDFTGRTYVEYSMRPKKAAQECRTSSQSSWCS